MAKELSLFSVEAIKANPKSYGAWYHRKWIITELKIANAPVDISNELRLCTKLLELDSRNCTASISFIARLTNSPLLELSMVFDRVLWCFNPIRIWFHNADDLSKLFKLFSLASKESSIPTNEANPWFWWHKKCHKCRYWIILWFCSK